MKCLRRFLSVVLIIASALSFPMRAHAAITALASAARTTTTSSADLTLNGKGVEVWFRITAVPGVDTVTLSIVGKDSVSGGTLTLLTGSAQNATTVVRYRIYPGLPAAANSTANDSMPDKFFITITHSAATSFTYSVSFIPLP